MKHVGVLVAAVTTLAFTAPAQATLLDFTITGDYSASFQLDSDTTPDDVYDGSGFVIWDVPGFADALAGVADVTFFNASIGGGIQLDDFYGSSVLLVTDGPQLYTGSESAPTFTLGTFALTEYLGSGTYMLTISSAGAPPTPAVPEPASWALMISGLGLAGAAMRRSKRSLTVGFQPA